MSEQSRLNVNINEHTKAHLMEVKAMRGTTITDALRVLVSVGHFVWRHHQDGYTVLVEKDGVANRVLFHF